MKKHNTTTFLVLTIAVLLLLLPIIPHHHHEGEVCTTVEYCRHDQTANDAHTRHHGDKTTCVAESHFFIIKSHADGCKLKAEQPIFPAAVAESMAVCPGIYKAAIAAPQYSNGYKPICLYPSQSLRAPPAA